MNIPSQTELSKGVFKQACLLFLPGSLVAIPFLILMFLGSLDNICPKEAHEKCSALLNQKMPFFYIFAFILSPLFGLIIENLGSILEKCLDCKNNISKDAWKLYLNSENDSKIIFKYIDSLVFRYKMELSMVWAFFFFLIEWGFIYINREDILKSEVFYSVLFTTLVALIFTLLHADYDCRVLDKLRISNLQQK